MKNNVLYLLILYPFFLCTCKQVFDAPPIFVTPNITANTSIKTLKTLHKNGNVEAITSNIVIRGIVVADDKSGNFFNQICIQDTTAGISIAMNGTNLFVNYPIGREVFIKCNGLYLGDFYGLVQLGGGVDNTVPGKPKLVSIASAIFDNYIQKGNWNVYVKPRTVTINQLNDTLQNTLVTIQNCQIKESGLNVPYIDNTMVLSDCNGSNVSIHTNTFAYFASLLPPTNNGNITTICSVFGTTPQLVLRDTTDFNFTNERCAAWQPQLFFFENFSDADDNIKITSTNWINFANDNQTYFVGNTYNSPPSYATISAHSAKGSVESWLISPAITIPIGSIQPTLSFQTIDGYDNGATLQAYISTNYQAGNAPNTAQWQILPAKISSGHASSYGSSLPSGDIDLSNYVGTPFVIGFQYVGKKTTQTTTFEITNISVGEKY